MKTKLIGVALIALTVAAVGFYPAARGKAIQVLADNDSTPSKIEVVFVLDTTSSMTDLIATAKEKIWSIATTMSQATPAPEIEMGLVAYRDRGDAYVTRVVDLSPDLDTMYATLMQFAAVGGGDGPEDVNRALDDAINGISWSQDPSSYQVVFLVGDAPPHMDYQNQRQYPEIVSAAAARGIVVNTIRCGEVSQTAGTWAEIARLGNGRYMQVSQAGDAFAVATPFDAELAKLSAELDSTRLFYGTEAERESFDIKAAATETLHALASTAAQARRAVFNAGVGGVANLFGDSDLVDDVESGRVALEDVPEPELPASIRAMSPEQQKAEIASIASRRDELRQRIGELTDARTSYIEEKVDEAGGAVDSLDHQIFEAVRDQAREKGFSYEGGPQF
jgi:Mg-chelatase subunit ChlD